MENWRWRRGDRGGGNNGGARLRAQWNASEQCRFARAPGVMAGAPAITDRGGRGRGASATTTTGVGLIRRLYACFARLLPCRWVACTVFFFRQPGRGEANNIAVQGQGAGEVAGRAH